MRDNEMVRRVDGGRHVVADDAGVLAARRHRASIRISQRDLLVLAGLQLHVDRIQSRDLLFQLRDFLLQPRDLGGRHVRASGNLPIRGFELRHVARDARVDALKPAFHFALGEVLVARVDGFELAAVDRNARVAEQVEFAAQRDERAAGFANGLAVVLAEIGDGLEVRRETARQPDQLDVALAFAFEAAARWDPVQVAVDVDLEHRRRRIAGSADIQRLGAREAELAETEPVDKGIDRTDRIVVADAVIEQCWKQRALAAIDTFHKPSHPAPADSFWQDSIFRAHL